MNKEQLIIPIKQEVKNNKKVHFIYFSDNSLWYKTQEGYIFPVPIDDTGNATFNSNEKAIHLMRWMRKWNEKIEKEE